ncbi:MAG: RidA family protein [Bacteroidales bacterium]|nr:RidA family protein [Bacteroidales bacterium]
MKQIISTDKAARPVGPYNQAVKVNNMLYVSGQIPLDPDTGELITGDVRDQTRMVMKNLQAILQAAGMDFSNVVKCSIFITDMHDFPKINEVYAGYFPENPPARETIQVGALPKFADVEISCIAAE